MAPHSSTLAWKIPWKEEPGRLQPMGLRRVRHDWATSLSLFSFMHWRRKWQPTPVFLPGESQGWGEPRGLPSLGSRRVRHDWSDLAAAYINYKIKLESVCILIWKTIVGLCAKSLQSHLTLCYPIGCSLPGSSVHGIFQATVLEWGAITFSFLPHSGPVYGKSILDIGITKDVTYILKIFLSTNFCVWI